MGRRKKSDESEQLSVNPNRMPPTTPQQYENRLIELAMKRAEQQLMDGTASSQVITQLLKSGSRRESIEQLKLQHDAELAKVKAEAYETEKEALARHDEVLKAFKKYSGNFNDD